MGMAKLAMKNASVSGNFKFNWTIGTESALDSSFFWGYLVTQVPGGFLASLYPANRIFGMAIATSSFLNLLVPGALKVDPIIDMCVQICKGLAEVRLIHDPQSSKIISNFSNNHFSPSYRESLIQLATVFGNSGHHLWKDPD